jgi:hypothetical protein
MNTQGLNYALLGKHQPLFSTDMVTPNHDIISAASPASQPGTR